jgi:hypothetical protein
MFFSPPVSSVMAGAVHGTAVAVKVLIAIRIIIARVVTFSDFGFVIASGR